MGVVEIGIERGGARQSRANLVRAQANLIGQDGIAKAQPGIRDALLNGLLPGALCARQIAFMQCDHSERGSYISGSRCSMSQVLEDLLRAIESTARQKHLPEEHASFERRNVRNPNLERLR